MSSEQITENALLYLGRGLRGEPFPESGEKLELSVDLYELGTDYAADWIDWAGGAGGGGGGPVAAEDVTFAPAGTIAATTVQAAIEEVATEAAGGGGSAHVIEDEGTPMTARANLNFVGAGVTVTDSSPDTIVTIPGAAGTAWTEVRKATDESVASNITPQNDDELFFTAASGVTYEIEVLLIYGSPAGAGTPDIKVGVGEDATARGAFLTIGLSTSDAALQGIQTANQVAGTLWGTAAANRGGLMTGTYVGGGGTFRVSWSQNTSGVNATIVRAGSVLRYRAIS